jgi:UDP-glucose-4-epimerase GalE
MRRIHKMNILVTGGAGYIGSHACMVLAQSGLTPVVYDNLTLGHTQAVQWSPLVIGDIGDAFTLRKTIRHFNIEAIMHFAAHAYVGESVSDPGKYYRNNLKNTLTLLDVMMEEKVKKMVFSSSCTVYGIPEHLPIQEASFKDPISPYGRSKYMIEKVLEDYSHAYGLQFAALRYFNVIGSDPEVRIGESHNPETHLLPLVIQAALGKRSSLDIYGNDYKTPDGTAVRDYVHVIDLVRGHLQALNWLKENPGNNIQINFGTGTGYSVLDIVKTVEAVLSKKVPIHVVARREGDPPILVAEAKLAKALLNWTPNYTLAESIQHAARWLEKPGY